MPIVASDAPDFLQNTRCDTNGMLNGNCTLISRPVDRNGIRTCFGPEYCSVYGSVRCHEWDGCRVSYEDLHAANADLLVAEAGGARLDLGVPFDYDMFWC